MAFFEYIQNNSGAKWDWGDSKSPLAEHVIIEALDSNHANFLAGNVGIYFNGCRKGIDCSCCGDRWIEIYEGSKGDSLPSIYGSPVGSLSEKDLKYSLFGTKGDIKKFCVIYFLNGEKEFAFDPYSSINKKSL